jgi:uncharacterized membrane protein YqaE (UPF0057 family)
MKRSLLALALVLLGASAAFACPFCASETGAQVRAGIFNSEFILNLALVLLPFPLLLGIVAFIYFGFPWSRETLSPTEMP